MRRFPVSAALLFSAIGILSSHAVAESYNTSPQPETKAQAIQFESQKARASSAEAARKADPFDSVSGADRSAERSNRRVVTSDPGERSKRRLPRKNAIRR